MNWIDIVILIILIVSVIWGARTGLFGAALYAVGTIIGWIVGGRVAQMIGSAFGDSLSIDTTVTVIVYILILGASFLLTRYLFCCCRVYEAFCMGLKSLLWSIFF